jgi:hypothetical protein
MTTDFDFVQDAAKEVGAYCIEVPDSVVASIQAVVTHPSRVSGYTYKTTIERQQYSHICYYDKKGNLLLAQTF